MQRACTNCASGPAKIVGHADLYVHSFLDADVIHKCRACGRLWTRHNLGGNTFEWTAANSAAGSLVP
ncbi:MAG TPA: hypothetical protein VFE23_20715 [Usitatibacter sp.]|jgi:hypothetical protein|nr:hypothetical protein [Usitatibacter sp.]